MFCLTSTAKLKDILQRTLRTAENIFFWEAGTSEFYAIFALKSTTFSNYTITKIVESFSIDPLIVSATICHDHHCTLQHTHYKLPFVTSKPNICGFFLSALSLLSYNPSNDHLHGTSPWTQCLYLVFSQQASHDLAPTLRDDCGHPAETFRPQLNC